MKGAVATGFEILVLDDIEIGPGRVQIIVHIGGWAPLAVLLFDFFTNNLTVNPIQAIEQRTGLYALTFLLLSLACTPGASLLGFKELLQRRKALGDYGFMYAALHMVTFFGIVLN